MRELRILIVEDDDLTRKTLRAMLEHEEFPVTEAADGVAALKLIAEDFFDVVITDVNMPGELNGMEVLQKCLEVRPHTAVIVVTGFATVEDAVEAMKKGATDYLVKPVRRAELVLRLDNIAANRQILKEALDLREAICTTEENAENTIKQQEWLIAEQQQLISRLSALLADLALAPEERLDQALNLLSSKKPA